MRPTTSHLGHDEQRRLLGGLLFLMTRASAGLASGAECSGVGGASEGGGGAVAEIRAEITANVWQVRAEVGQHVAAGDELVILESMKMEIPVLSPLAGTITEMRVQPDDKVKEGDVVAVIESDAP